MTKHIAVISVRGGGYHPSRRLTQAAKSRDARVSVLHPYHLIPAVQKGRADLLGRQSGNMPDVVLPRQGSEIKTVCLPLIAFFERHGVPVINDLQAILTARHKYLSLQALNGAGLPVPDTVYIAERGTIHRALEYFSGAEVVVKTVRGRQGSGVHRLEPDRPTPESLIPELTKGNGLLLQQFIAPEIRRDIRAFVIGNNVVGAMELIPPEGEFRANFHRGGTSKPIVPGAEITDLAVRAAQAVNLEIAGVDLMLLDGGRQVVIEVNYAPGFRGLEQATGLDIASMIVDYALSRC